MKKFIYLVCLAAASFGFSSCDDLFDPAIENNQDLSQADNNAPFADGILANAYTHVPGGYSFSEVATDDAVSNDIDNSYRKMAAGSWTSNDNPMDQWHGYRSAILYINLFLSKVNDVKWSKDPIVSEMFRDRETGEAYALRAMFNFYLLQAHAGFTAEGELLGVPIVTDYATEISNFNIPRETFRDCVTAIRKDAAMALELLPLEYGDAAEMQRIQARYPNSQSSQVNRVFGSNFVGRISGRIVEAFLAKLNLLGASPAFSSASGISWEETADAAATVLDRIGGLAGFDPTGNTWYCNTEDIKNFSQTNMPKEYLWPGSRANSNSLEKDNYPPTVYGNGRVNPTQNFVDAFPMLNGYPITDKANSGYNPDDPYAGRDPRLALYVTYNGMTSALSNAVITTASDGNDNNALNKLQGSSTRTGYYLRKLLRQDISLDPNGTSEEYHISPRLRFTEMFLIYAEAANEAWGPTGTGRHGYSAYDIIKAIRERAGIGLNNGDPYLQSAAADKDKMRELIRNERRIELSFEGHRFWDLRRWKAPLNETAKGMDISGTSYNVFDVDTRNYDEYMYYGPIPNSEILKFNALKQNAGW